MTALNRKFSSYSDRYEFSLDKYTEWGCVLMRSYKARQMRENVVSGMARKR